MRSPHYPQGRRSVGSPMLYWALGCPGRRQRAGVAMNITAVTPFAVRVGRTRALYVKVETDEGLTGLGESGLWGRELAVAECVRSAETLLVGQDPSRIDHLWQVMFRGTFWKGGPVLGAA